MTPRPPSTSADFDPDLWCLFDQYVHGDIDRRGFLDRAARFAAASGTTAAALLAALSPDFARAQKVAPGDARLKTESVTIDSPAGYGKVRAYVARPAQTVGPLPVVLVVHENRGLNPHIEDITRRLALDNFIAVAPDALHPLGGYPGDEDKARELFAKLDQAKTREDFVVEEGGRTQAVESFEAVVVRTDRPATPDEPREVFRRRFDLMCVQRNLKALGTFGYMATVRSNPVYLQHIPRNLAHARHNLSRYPELERLWRTLLRHVPELG